MTVLSMADVSLGVFFGLFFPIGYFSGKTIARIASDLAFLEGTVIFFLGSLLAFFHSGLSSRMIILMIVGAAMIGLSVVFGLLI